MYICARFATQSALYAELLADWNAFCRQSDDEDAPSFEILLVCHNQRNAAQWMEAKQIKHNGRQQRKQDERPEQRHAVTMEEGARKENEHAQQEKPIHVRLLRLQSPPFLAGGSSRRSQLHSCFAGHSPLCAHVDRLRSMQSRRCSIERAETQTERVQRRPKDHLQCRGQLRSRLHAGMQQGANQGCALLWRPREASERQDRRAMDHLPIPALTPFAWFGCGMVQQASLLPSMAAPASDSAAAISATSTAASSPSPPSSSHLLYRDVLQSVLSCLPLSGVWSARPVGAGWAAAARGECDARPLRQSSARRSWPQARRPR